MLEVEGITVRFSGLTAVSDVSFVVGAGEVLTMMGPNGAGKTTAFNAITGITPLSSGSIRFDGEDISRLRPHQIAARGIRRTFQSNGILREMSVLENVLSGLELSTPSCLTGVLLGGRASVEAERQATRAAKRQLADMGILDLATKSAGSLSFGQQRMVEISRALVSGARLMMLDEPAVGLSPAERIQLGETLRSVAARGVGILLVEHVQDLVAAVSDRIVVLNYGRKIAEGLPDEVRRNKIVLEAYLGAV